MPLVLYYLCFGDDNMQIFSSGAFLIPYICSCKWMPVSANVPVDEKWKICIEPVNGNYARGLTGAATEKPGLSLSFLW